jgi:hypothetical protein
VRNIRRGLKSVWIAGLVLAWLLCANVAAADTVTAENDATAGNVPGFDDWVGDVPASGLNGWFFDPDPGFSFPEEPDPSQPWTSAANIVTLDYWLSLVEELGDDPSLLWQLYGLGMISSPDLAPAQLGQLIESNSQLVSQENASLPEPITWGLVCGGLVFLALLCRSGRAKGYGVG